MFFVVLFAGFAIDQGIGSPSVPAGAVAIVQQVPDDLGTITQAEFDKSLVQVASQSSTKKVPKVDTKAYEELKSTALGTLLDSVWIQGQAAEMGVTVTDKQIADEFQNIKKQNFKTQELYEKFLKTSQLTQSDVNERVKIQLLSTAIQKRLGENPPKPSSTEIQDYYDESKATQFTKFPTRDARVITNKNKAKAEQALALLEKDNSPASWGKVAKKFSSDPTSKTKGGLVEGLSQGSIGEPLDAAVFDAPIGKVEGIVKTSTGFIVFQVEKTTPTKVQTLAEVKAQVTSQLTEAAQQQDFTEFLANYTSKWTSRTFCASDYAISRCANFKGSGHPESAPPGCFDADAKAGLPEACPSPVLQLAPAIPGSVTILAPKGQQLPQRPQPAGLKPASKELTVPGTVPGATTVPPPSG